MKKIVAILLFSTAFVSFFNSSVAQDTTIKKKFFDSIVKRTDSVKLYADSIKKISNPVVAKTTEETGYGPTEIIKLVIVSAFFLIMALLLILFFRYIKSKDQRIGYQSIKLIGLILIFPGVCILAIGGQSIMESETLAALFGTIAGYVLSREDDTKDTTVASKAKEEELNKKIKTLEDEIAVIKQKNPNLIV